MMQPKRIVLLGTALALVCLSGCGGGGSSMTSSSTPTTTRPTPRPPEVVLQDGFALPAGYLAGAYFDISATGTIEATVDYTFADTTLLVWIAKGACTGDQFEADQCVWAATSFAGAKPRKVSATNQAAGRYTLIVGNASEKDESLSVQVMFTAAASAAGQVTAAGRRSSAGGMAWLRKRRIR